MPQKAGLYIHIPFCESKCYYCDFYSLAPAGALRANYVGALKNQLLSFAPMEFDSLYFGGGTPSLLAPAELAALIDDAAARHALAKDSEITLELNPGDADLQTLRGFRAAGINRLSVGVQTTDDAQLAAIGRRHTAAQALETLSLAAAAGFANISADLLLGLPGDSGAARRSIEAVAPRVSHLSAYLLKLMEGTPFGERPPERLPDEDAAAAQYLSAVASLEQHGLIQYEISNFARPGFESRHNLKYWQLAPYLGLGAAAASLLGARRYRTPANAAAFAARYQTPQSDPLADMTDEGPITAQDYIIVRLRTTQGLSLQELNKTYNYSMNKQNVAFLERCAQQGLCRFDGDRLALTPRGMLVSNSILSRLI